jgi:tetratricopeptide (TPR) repeat protein
LRLLILSFLALSSFAQQASMEVNPNLFAVMAAINAAGYDSDLASNANSPIRGEIRKWVESSKIPVLEQLKEFYAARRKEDPARNLSQFISFALCIEKIEANDGPEFRYRLRIADLPPDVQELDGFEKLLTLLANNQALLDRALEPYHSPVTLALQQIDGYLRNPRNNGVKGQFYVYLDVLAAPNQIHVRSYGNDLFVVLTPSPEPQVDYIKSAYMHFQIDPIAMRHIADIETKASLSDFAQGAPALDPQYKKDFALLTVACLTKAVDARMMPSMLRQSAIDQSLREGFILTPYFAEALKEYEVQEQSMRFYLPILVKGIDLKKETARLDAVKFDNTPRERKAKVAPQPVIEKSLAEKTLDEAEEFYGQKNYTKAGELFRQALEQTNSRPLKGRAYYGLARLAALNRDPETAVQLFERTISEGAEAQVSAWAHVFAGRLLDLAQDNDAAKKHFEAALATAGASPASRKAAEDGLKGIRPSRP